MTSVDARGGRAEAVGDPARDGAGDGPRPDEDTDIEPDIEPID
jgi:hypothetical protein